MSHISTEIQLHNIPPDSHVCITDQGYTVGEWHTFGTFLKICLNHLLKSPNVLIVITPSAPSTSNRDNQPFSFETRFVEGINHHHINIIDVSAHRPDPDPDALQKVLEELNEVFQEAMG